MEHRRPLSEDIVSTGSSWIDAHCHLADPRFAETIEQVIERSRVVGVDRWIQGGVDPADWKRQQALRNRFGTGIWMCFGIHPWIAAAHTNEALDGMLAQLEASLAKPIVGLGELGLDFHPRRLGDAADRIRAKQRRVFAAQLQLGIDHELPLILHVVKAHDEVTEILARAGPFPRGGLVHSFSGSLEQARRYRALGFHLSLGASGTRSEKKSSAYASLGVNAFVFETDAPDQALNRLATDINEPAQLIDIVRVWASRWQVDAKTLLSSSRTILEHIFSGWPQRTA